MCFLIRNMVQTSSIFFYDGAEKLLPHQPQAVSNTKWMMEPGQRQRNRLKPLFELIFFFLLVITPPLVIGSGRRPSCRMQSWWIGLRVTHRDKTDERGEGGAERGTMTNSWKGKQGQMTYRIPSRAHTYLDLCKYTHQHCFGGTHFQFHYRYLLWSARELTLRTNAQPSDG